MRPGVRLRDIGARTGFALATALVLGLALREVLARLALRDGGAMPAALEPALARDAALGLARGSARRNAGDTAGARAEALAALATRPRDPDLLLLLAECTSAPMERLRFAAVAARAAPYTVAPAEFAFAIAFAAVEARASRAAAAREAAARLATSSVTEGLAEARAEATAEALRLEGEMRACLELALATHAATSPTARGMRFLEDSLARARRLVEELDAP